VKKVEQQDSQVIKVIVKKSYLVSPKALAMNNKKCYLYEIDKMLDHENNKC
jgi:hypothetical protein